jgi:peptidoglycan biosynthesis protein MviN/MurJ (putative lipid II flippase)
MNVLAAVVNVVWNVVLLYFVRDILVAAWSTLGGYAIAFGYVLKSLDGEWPIDWQPAIIVKSLVASGLMGGFVVLLRQWAAGHDGIGMIAVEIAAGAVAYGCALLAVGGVSPKEIAFMKAQLR